MRTVSGEVKANKKDIEAIRVFLDHAKQDMDYGGDGSYVLLETCGITNELDERELKKGKLGLENIEFILTALCPKWREEYNIL